MNREWRGGEAVVAPKLVHPRAREYPTAYQTAALRSRLVSNLTGLSVARLQYWHTTVLQVAHRRAGARGTPRLYSWIDYQRLCIIAGLLADGVTTERIRIAVAYLDDLFPEWYKLSLEPWEGKVPVPGSPGQRHVAIRQRLVDVLADAAGQLSFRKQLQESWSVDELAESLATGLGGLSAKGPLYQLGRFADVVVMNPAVNVGLPTLRGSRLETSFLHGLVELSNVQAIAKLYHLDEAQLRRAEAFEREAAA
jgi:DNA-binding transcriptional MerR regulator